MNKLNLQEIEQNARQVFNKDGLMYLFFGCALVFTGFSFYDSRFGALAGLVALLFFPLKALRERITYPRVGYVEFFVPENFGRKKLGFLMVMTASLVLLAYVANGRFPIMPIGFTILFGLILYFAASVKNGIRLRDWVVIGLALAIGGLATYLFENWRMGTAVQMWLMAVLFILIGTVDLIQFMHKYPVREVHNDATN